MCAKKYNVKSRHTGVQSNMRFMQLNQVCESANMRQNLFSNMWETTLLDCITFISTAQLPFPYRLAYSKVSDNLISTQLLIFIKFQSNCSSAAGPVFLHLTRGGCKGDDELPLIPNGEENFCDQWWSRRRSDSPDNDRGQLVKWRFSGQTRRKLLLLLQVGNLQRQYRASFCIKLIQHYKSDKNVWGLGHGYMPQNVKICIECIVLTLIALSFEIKVIVQDWQK